MPGRYVEPEYGITPFTCPFCHTLAPQEDGEAAVTQPTMGGRSIRHVDDSIYLTYCTSCGKKAVWARLPDFMAIVARIADGQPKPDGRGPEVVKMVYPHRSQAPDPNPDLPEDIKADYREAASVLGASPRSAAALLRLALQKLCVHLGQPGENINLDIKALVAAGTVRPIITTAMDTVRIAGNESVHPGELNLNDDPEIARTLFQFINLIAEEAITLPAKVAEMFSKMPEDKKAAVARRDGVSP